MRKLRITAMIVCLSVMLGLFAMPALAEDNAQPKLGSAECALLGDMGTGRILYNANAYSRHAPASLTKIMTMLLAVEAIESGSVSADDTVTAGADCKTGLGDDSSTAGIYIGESMSLEDLLYCAALASANEACNIIAVHIAGSIEAFVDKMNVRADELGCSGTHFTNTHGMPDPDHYSTARDIFIISCEAMRHPLFAKLVGTSEHTVSATNLSPERRLKSSNALICSDSVYTGKYRYDGAVGIKTGYTDAAGYCLVGAVQRDGVNVITVILGADGDKEKKEFDSFADSVKLLDWCFENYSYRSIVKSGAVVGTQPIEYGGASGTVELLCAGDVNALAENSLDAAKLKRTVNLNAETLTAECPEGTELGTVSFADPNDGAVYATVKLVAGKTVMNEQTETQPQTPQGLRSDQKLALVIVCALFVVTTLTLLLLAARKRRAKRSRRKMSKTKTQKRPQSGARR